jgi:hypothetical protein
MVNEALCKVLCHNVCCLIQSACVLGIEARFWGKEEKVIEKTDDREMEVWDWV